MYLNTIYQTDDSQPQDTTLASAPTAEPTGQVTVSGFKPQPVRTDVQPELGVARPIPQNKAQEALGYIGELLTKAGVQLDKVGLDIPVLGRISLKDLTVGESGKVLEDMALGFYPVEGAGGFISGTTRIKPDPALELLNIVPIAGAAAKAGGKAVVKGATKAVQATKGMPVGMSTQMVGKGVSELGFYSAAKEAVDSIQQPKGTGEQFLKQIEKTPGVKPEEIKWTGLDDFLKSKKSVTKAEVQEYLDKNRVEIKEVRLGEQETYNPARLQQLENEWSKLKQHPIDDPSFGEEKYDEMIRLMNIRDRSTTDSLYKLYDEAITDGQMAQRMGNKALADKFFKEAELYNTRAEKLDLEGLGMDAPTKFSKYTLPGGENYREILLTLPFKEPAMPKGYQVSKMEYDDGTTRFFAETPTTRSSAYKTEAEANAELQKMTEGLKDFRANLQSFKSQHFDQPNILAHMRVNDRVDADGKKVLFVEEVQSDWHQAGRKKGYKGAMPLEQAKQKMLADGYSPEAIANSSDADIIKTATEYGVPDAPFKTTWHELALKRAIQLASEGGYDRIAFTTGKTQAERFDLSKQIDDLTITRRDTDFSISATDKSGKPAIMTTVQNLKNLDEIIGKDLANKVKDDFANKSGNEHTYAGLDLQVGGEGMKGFYDTILPKFLDKYAKKWDAKVGMTDIITQKASDNYPPNIRRLEGGRVKKGIDKFESVQYIDITPKMKESVLTKGQPLFAVGGAGAAMQQEDNK